MLLGVEAGDSLADADSLASQIAKLRIFPSLAVSADFSEQSESSDTSTALNKQWEKNVVAIDGEILCISQFTLLASVKKNKPSFHRAEKREFTIDIYERNSN